MATRRLLIATVLSAVLLVAAFICLGAAAHPRWLAYALVGAAALLAMGGYAQSIRFVPGRLPLFGKGRVLVRGLDDWTMYQYNVPFDQASAEQQSHALDHYKVGDRLFPARPKDGDPKKTWLQAGASLVSLCSLITISEALHGWYRLYLFLLFYAWLWLCTRLSKHFEGSAPNPLTTIDTHQVRNRGRAIRKADEPRKSSCES